MKKRSQMEIMGIAIVVIMLSIIILFVVRWSILKKPADYKKEFAQSEIAANFVSTLRSTTTDCKGMNFDELFQDCFENIESDGKTDCNGDGTGHSCTYAQTELNIILSKTLDSWGYKYQFVVTNNVNDKIKIEKCKDAQGNTIKERKTRTEYFPGGLEAKLAICG